MSLPLLHYQLYGEANKGIPLLFLHGMLGELQNWNGQAKLFAQDYRVIAVDLRNHGDSPHLKGMGYRQMAEDIRQLLEYLGISDVHLSGHSMGGKVAMYLALSNPQLIRKLVVVDIAPVAYPPWHQPIFRALLSLPLEQFASRRDADEYLAKDISEPFERAFLLKNLMRSQEGFAWKGDLEEIARNYLKIASFPKLEQQFESDVLFIRGQQSDYISDEYKPEIKHYFPGAILETIANAGHLPHVQQPQVFYQRVYEFLAN